MRQPGHVPQPGGHPGAAPRQHTVRGWLTHFGRKKLIRFRFWFWIWVWQRVSGTRLRGELDHDRVGKDEGDVEKADGAAMGRVARATIGPRRYFERIMGFRV